MDKCYIVLHKNYEEGESAYAFYKKQDAEISVNEDAKTVERDLKEQGYLPVVLAGAYGNITIFVSNSDIYYEWSIAESDIQ